MALVRGSDALSVEYPGFHSWRMVWNLVGRIAGGGGPDHLGNESPFLRTGWDAQNQERPDFALITQIRQPDITPVHSSSN